MHRWVWRKLPLMGWLPKPYHWPQVSISPCGLEGADFSEIGEKHRVGKGQWKITPLSGFVFEMCLYGLMNTCIFHKWVTWLYMFYEQMLDNDTVNFRMTFIYWHFSNLKQKTVHYIFVGNLTKSASRGAKNITFKCQMIGLAWRANPEIVKNKL